MMPVILAVIDVVFWLVSITPKAAADCTFHFTAITIIVLIHSLYILQYIFSLVEGVSGRGEAILAAANGR